MPVLVLDAAEFAYEHFGRFVAPQSRDAWLKHKGRLIKNSNTYDKALASGDAIEIAKAAKKGAVGERSSGMGGTSIFISASRVRIFGPDYADQGFAATGGAGEARAFAYKMLFTAAKEPWLMVIFGKPNVFPGMLHLNQPGDTWQAYYDGKEKRLVRARPDSLDAIARMLAGMQAKDVKAALSLGIEHMAFDHAEKAPNEKGAKKLHALYEKYPNLRAATRRAVLDGQDIALVGQRIAMKDALHV